MHKGGINKCYPPRITTEPSLQPTAAHVYSQTAQFENLGELVKMVIFAA